IVRSVGLYLENGLTDHADYNFVMGVASGMPADPDLVPLLLKYKKPGCPWQATVIGREDVWPVHKRVAELGGNLRTGLEDCFYLPDGTKAASNGVMIEALAGYAKEAGRAVASPAEARAMLGVAG
ncbi:MAG: 3-keto-5-aminohexanoate cleavage protein, partial [Pseudomonadota bacterium]